MNIIAHIYTDFPDKFGVPRQSGLVSELKGKIIFEPEYAVREALRGIEEFSHLWLIWQFSEHVDHPWSPTVRPPRLGGNKRIGVFATRSPFRPNPIGLSCVRLEKVEESDRGLCLIVSGADLMNGTPIYDIKPYLSFTDSHPEACASYADVHRGDQLKVKFEPEILNVLPREKRESLIAVLAEDPRPHYQKDPERIYHMNFSKWKVSFSVCDDELEILSITEEMNEPAEIEIKRKTNNSSASELGMEK